MCVLVCIKLQKEFYLDLIKWVSPMILYKCFYLLYKVPSWMKYLTQKIAVPLVKVYAQWIKPGKLPFERIVSVQFIFSRVSYRSSNYYHLWARSQAKVRNIYPFDWLVLTCHRSLWIALLRSLHSTSMDWWQMCWAHPSFKKLALYSALFWTTPMSPVGIL